MKRHIDQLNDTGKEFLWELGIDIGQIRTYTSEQICMILSLQDTIFKNDTGDWIVQGKKKTGGKLTLKNIAAKLAS